MRTEQKDRDFRGKSAEQREFQEIAGRNPKANNPLKRSQDSKPG
jgi:hypothetical protein